MEPPRAQCKLGAALFILCTIIACAEWTEPSVLQPVSPKSTILQASGSSSIVDTLQDKEKDSSVPKSTTFTSAITKTSGKLTPAETNTFLEMMAEYLSLQSVISTSATPTTTDMLDDRNRHENVKTDSSLSQSVAASTSVLPKTTDTNVYERTANTRLETFPTRFASYLGQIGGGNVGTLSSESVEPLKTQTSSSTDTFLHSTSVSENRTSLFSSIQGMKESEGNREITSSHSFMFSSLGNPAVDFADEEESFFKKCSSNYSSITNTLPNVTSGFLAHDFINATCVRDYNWILDLPKENGCVLDFHHVEMHFEDSLLVVISFSGQHQVVVNITEKNVQSLAPLMLRADSITVRVSLTVEPFLWTSSPSSFNISFTILPARFLPNQMVLEINKPMESHKTYLCTGLTLLPTEITCDGVRHCEHGEDERDCSYTQVGCGDWFPYNNHCLKAKFFNRHLFHAAPREAEDNCRSQYNASLAELPDSKGIQIAANLIRKSGFLNAVVGIRKFRPVSAHTRHLYRFMWQWGGPGSSIAYEQEELQRSGTLDDCGILNISPQPVIQSVSCRALQNRINGYICMRPKLGEPTDIESQKTISLGEAIEQPDQFPTKTCSDGSVVQTFHQCYWGQHGNGHGNDHSLEWSPGNLPLFQCRLGTPVHYSLLCDGNADCADHSDETGCHKPQFAPLLESTFFCRSSQTVPARKQCDGVLDCSDESDEEYCSECQDTHFCQGVGCMPWHYTGDIIDTCPGYYLSVGFLANSLNTGSVELDGYGMSRLNSVIDQCPEGFYECMNGLCIPSFLINNGEKDCVRGEDESVPVSGVSCPGYYRCKGEGNCVHKNYLCDGIYHCPYRDDEVFCDMLCPQDAGCTCEGHAFTCSEMFNPLQHLHVRYLDLSHVANVSLENIHVMEYLFFLNLSYCNVSKVYLSNMPHLQILDLSFNSLSELASVHFHKLSSLRHLHLSSNPMGKTLSGIFNALMIPGELSTLMSLTITDTNLVNIPDKMFHSLTKLKSLDLRDNPLQHYHRESFHGLDALEVLLTDQSKLCCRYFHSHPVQCNAPVDELSTCDDLLAQTFLRVFLWVVCVLAIVGNAGVLTYRVITDARGSVSASAILLKNLCAADFLMGVYLAMIGVADSRFHGNYVAREAQWISSVACTITGCISFISSEVSAFLICMITLDRVLVICFPFKLHLHLSSKFAAISCVLIWILGIILATLPLILRMEFYGLNSICLPLPITRQPYSGQTYAFIIFIVVNFVLFLFISVGQVLIYRAVRQARKAIGGRQQRDKDMTLAHRLFLVVFTDFCCWCPVGVMGLLAFHGIPIPVQLNVWTVIFILPVNSALNPFLYTLNGLLEQWEKRRMEQREQRMMGKLQTEVPKWQPSAIKTLTKICIMSKKVDKSTVLRYFESANIPSSCREESVPSATSTIEESLKP